MYEANRVNLREDWEKLTRSARVVFSKLERRWFCD